MAESAVIGYVHPGTVRAEFCASLLALQREARTRIEMFLAMLSGPNISTARNLMCHRFLTECGAPWLLMIDTDMVFAADALDRLIAAADPASRPIIGALCYSQDMNGVAHPTAYQFTEDGSGEPGFIHYRIGPGEDECMEVSATGAAFLLAHRAALEKISADSGDAAAPWFRETTLGSGLMGEDLTFCLRARDAGIPIHVCPDVGIGHMKTTMLGEVR